MTNLFNKLFETFDSLSSSDAKEGVIGGIVSPYSIPAKDSLGISIESLNTSKAVQNQIVMVHKKCSDHINMASAPNITGFKTLCSRILSAIELNKVFKDNPLLPNKLSEILAYSYICKNKDYLIYPDFNAAKTKAKAVFDTANKLGLVSLSPNDENTIKTLLLSVFYSPKKNEPEMKK
jgi:hypothetical protein